MNHTHTKSFIKVELFYYVYAERTEIMSTHRSMTVVCLLSMLAIIFFLGVDKGRAQAETTVQPQAADQAAYQETQKSVFQKRQEAKQRLADALKTRDPKFTEAAANTSLVAQHATKYTKIPAGIRVPTVWKSARTYPFGG